MFQVSLALLFLSMLHWILHLPINGFQAASRTVNSARLVKDKNEYWEMRMNQNGHREIESLYKYTAQQ